MTESDSGTTTSNAEDRHPSPDDQTVLSGYGGVAGVLAILLVVGAIACALSSEVRDQVAMSFTRQPQQFTELYFSAARPVQVSPAEELFTGALAEGQQVVNVFFTVANREGPSAKFPYAVQVINDQGVVAGRLEGSVEVTGDSSSAVWATVNIAAGEEWSSVDVSLLGRAEHIRFLREKQGL